MSPVKVDLVREPESPWAPKPTVTVLRLLPFAWKGPGRYVHRPRSATLHDGGTRLSVHAWCGQLMHRPTVLAEVPEGAEVCATCEGRAAGAGQIDSGFDDPIVFRPRAHREPCGWERGRRGYAWTDYYPCGRRSSALAELDGRSVHVCREHRRSAIVRGWTVTDISPDWRHR